jgi:glycosyltransferase involved in cell wall biosynthesis
MPRSLFREGGVTGSICFVGLDNYPVLDPRRGNEYFGGESVQQTLLAKAFASLGYRVSMVVKDHGQRQGESIGSIQVWKAYAEEAGIPVIRFVHPRMTSILGALEKADADVYYQSCAGMTTGLVAWHCARRSRRFIFRLAHDTDCIPGQQLIRFWRDRKIYEYGLRRAHFIAAQGTHQVALLRQNYGLESLPINMAVEEPAEPAAAQDIDVLWVNNLRGFKRPELAVDLAARLPGRQVVMIGGAVPGNEALFDEIRARARRVQNLEFLGAVPYHEVNAYFGRARVFVNTSDQEGFPNSFLQAWIRGVPVVSFFDPDGLIESKGLGHVPSDLTEMTEAVESLLSDEASRALVSARCRRHAYDHYAPTAVARRYVEAGALGGGVSQT